MSVSRRRSRVVISLLALGPLAACSSGARTATPNSAPTAPPMTEASPGSRVTSATDEPRIAGAVTKTSDIAYLTLNGIELTLDVYANDDSPGPGPVVVAFHGLSTALKNSEDTTAVAAAAAESGMVVFAPSWIAGDPFPLRLDDITMLATAANCAVAFAQASAASYGGDPETTVTYGFSAGTSPALAAAVTPASTAVPGCRVDTVPTPVDGVVLGDGEYFWQSEEFDDAFVDDLDGMQDAVADFIDPLRWPSDLNAVFELWAADDGTAARPVGNASDEGAWLAQRDPDGSIRSDLAQLDQLDDGVISYVDSAQVLDLRLTEAGHVSSLELLPGGHTTLDKIPLLVDALASASGAA